MRGSAGSGKLDYRAPFMCGTVSTRDLIWLNSCPTTQDGRGKESFHVRQQAVVNFIIFHGGSAGSGASWQLSTYRLNSCPTTKDGDKKGKCGDAHSRHPLWGEAPYRVGIPTFTPLFVSPDTCSLPTTSEGVLGAPEATF